MNAIKIEDLHYSEEYWSEVSEVLKDFLTNEIGHMTDWINEIECRRRDGFIPFSHNKGGYSGYHYGSQLDHYFEPTGFKKFDEACKTTYNYLVDCFLEDKKISLEDYNKGIDDDCKEMLDLREEIEQSFGEYEACNYETMLKVKDSNTLEVSFFLQASDAPYFRGYDDSIEVDVTFNSVDELKKKLDEITDRSDVQSFIDLVNR